MYVRGVHATTLDDVRAATGTSKSQLYRHFPDKDTLVHAVIARRGQQVPKREGERLERLSSFNGLIRWRDALIEVNSLQNGAYGCASYADFLARAYRSRHLATRPTGSNCGASCGCGDFMPTPPQTSATGRR